MSIKRLMIAAAIAALPVGTDAATLNLHYTTFADGVFPASTVNARLTVEEDIFFGAPAYVVTGITGFRDGVAITGFDPFSTVFFPDDGAGSIVDSFGLTFTAGSRDFNLYRYNDAFYSEYSYVSGEFGNDGEGRLIPNGALTLTAVPEPASWTLMIAGFGAAGLAMRRRRVAAA